MCLPEKGVQHTKMEAIQLLPANNVREAADEDVMWWTESVQQSFVTVDGSLSLRTRRARFAFISTRWFAWELWPRT